MRVCSFEIAKKLKENNIDIPSIDAYAIDDVYYFPPGSDTETHTTAGNLVFLYDQCYFKSFEESYRRLIDAPIVIDILNWLAIRKNIYVSIVWEPTIIENTNRRCVYIIMYDNSKTCYNNSSELFNTYEEAIEAAIKEIFNKIFK